YAAWQDYSKKAGITKDIPKNTFVIMPVKKDNQTAADWIKDERSWSCTIVNGHKEREYEYYADMGGGWRKNKSDGLYYIMRKDLTKRYLENVEAALKQVN